MHDPRDVECVKILRRELMKHFIDATLADVRVSHGVAYIRGVLKPLPGCGQDFKHEVDHVHHMLKCRSEFRDVVVDVHLQS